MIVQTLYTKQTSYIGTFSVTTLDLFMKKPLDSTFSLHFSFENALLINNRIALIVHIGREPRHIKSDFDVEYNERIVTMEFLNFTEN